MLYVYYGLNTMYVYYGLNILLGLGDTMMNKIRIEVQMIKQEIMTNE